MIELNAVVAPPQWTPWERIAAGRDGANQIVLDYNDRTEQLKRLPPSYKVLQ
jgi:hypothetical protein